MVQIPCAADETLHDRRVRVIVTGGNSGVGAVTAATLAADGHRVVIACRTIPKAKRAAATMRGEVTIGRLDLADLPSMMLFSRELSRTVDHPSGDHRLAQRHLSRASVQPVGQA